MIWPVFGVPVVASLTFLLLCGQRVHAQSPLTVCMALSDAKDHQEVVIRGELYGSLRHGFVLSEGLDADPCPGRPQRILAVPALIPFELRSTLDVKLTAEQEAANEAVLRRWLAPIRQTSLPIRQQVVMRGVIVKKAWMLSFRRSDGVYFGNGFGPTGGFAAILVVKSIWEHK